MFYTPEQKRYTAVTLGLIVILLVVTFSQKSNFQFQDPTDYAALQEQSRLRQQAYEQLLAASQPDPQASQKLFETIITEAEVKAEIEEELDSNQTIRVPEIPDTAIVKTSATGQQAVVDYLTEVGTTSLELNNKLLNVSTTVFHDDQDPAALQDSIVNNQSFVNRLVVMPVPQEAVAFHKAQLLIFQEFGQLLGVAKDYQTGVIANPWPLLYRQYAHINQGSKNLKAEFQKLDARYQLSSLPPIPIAHATPAYSGISRYLGVPQANAVFGIGDTTIIIGNIPQAIIEAIKQALATAFARFATQFLDKLIATIESNYKIANFLYYSDALVQGQYVNDYLDKYVGDTLDRSIITRFIPQFNCGTGNQEELRQIFQAKAEQYLGFDPQAIDPADPDYYSKMLKAGSYLARPDGWKLHYEAIAQAARSEAERAVDRELTSTGLKSPRDLVTNQIKVSLGAIESAQNAVFNANLNLGVVNVENIVSKIVSGVLNNLFNKFLFNGAVVLQEQKVCIAKPELSPVIPTTDTSYDYQEPPPPPTPTQIRGPNP
jgi:hypothetical protein